MSEPTSLRDAIRRVLKTNVFGYLEIALIVAGLIAFVVEATGTQTPISPHRDGVAVAWILLVLACALLDRRGR